ncbi:MAG: DNA polymerase domain-containing protein [Euryarchaeota archaeon]|nr:DNA polymerase domain-containing protein [Euryarchaeota archaeon]
MKLTRVRFTNLNKELFPGITKAQVIEYYIKVAPKMLPYLRDRAVVMHRFPDGIEKEGFFEKDAPPHAPGWVRTFRRYSRHAGREINYVVGGSLDTLLWLANLASIEINVTLSRVDDFERPDLVLIDIDPLDGFAQAREAALEIGDLLSQLGLRCYVKTSGKRGLHVLIPIVREYSFADTRAFVRELSRAVRRPEVKVDYAQNAVGKTVAAPYSLRPLKGAPVSAPVSWEELEKGLSPAELNIYTVPEREDPWQGFFEPQRLIVHGAER